MDVISTISCVVPGRWAPFGVPGIHKFIIAAVAVIHVLRIPHSIMVINYAGIKS